MNKHLFHLPHWHHAPRTPTNIALQLIALPLLTIGALLVLSGALDADLGTLAVGVIGLLAGVAVERQRQ
jgi:hydrogenase/urease accessory protein HupE